jgi:zinc protease
MLQRNIAPTVNPIEQLQINLPKEKRLSNGLNIFSLSDNEFDLIKLEFVFSVGSKHSKLPLLTQFTNALIFDGTERYTSDEIAEKFEYYGAQVKSNVSSDRSLVGLVCLKKHLPELLPFFTEVIFSANYPQHEIDLYAQRKKQDYILNRKKVSFLAGEQLNKALFNQTPYQSNTTEESFGAITREDVVDFYSNNYKTNYFEVFCAGNLSDADLTFIGDCLSPHFYLKQEQKAFNSITHSPTTVVKQTIVSGTQSCIKLGKLIDVEFASEDFFYLKFINTLFGGYFGSRLMQNIREDKGYTYGIGSSFLTLEDAKYFLISTEIDNTYVDASLNEISNEFDSLLSSDIAENELHLVNNYIKGSLLKANDGVFLKMENAKYFHHHNHSLEYFDAYFQFLSTVNPNKIKQVVEQYLQKNTFSTIVIS